ncbi:MAG: hypothetical protein U0794_12015 [Isosphaeraceae bacterium]
MIQAFNYFYDEEARAIFLLTNAYNRNGETTLGRSTQIRFPTDAPAVGTAEQQKTAKDHYAAIVATMPQFAIPSWMIIDTRGAHLGWSQFDGLNVGPYSSKNVMRSYLSGSAGQYKYIPATSNAAAKLAHDAEVASGIPFGDLVWHTPTSAQTRDLTKGYSGNATSYLTSHGFNANVYTYQVWTSDIERKPAYLNNTTYYDTYSTEVSTVAGTDNKWFYFPDNAPNSTNVKKYTGGGVLSIYYVTNTHGRFWV